MVVFQALTWEARDLDELEHCISIIGRTDEGKSICLTTNFHPYFFIKLPKNASNDTCKHLYEKIDKTCGGDVVKSYTLVSSKDLWGFQNNTKSHFMKLNLLVKEMSY